MGSQVDERPEGHPLTFKTRNNVLAVLSKALAYAEEVDLIEEVPRIRLYKSEPPEVVCWDFAEWRRLLETGGREGQGLLVSIMLAGDAGLRLGEVLGLRWEDVDLIAGASRSRGRSGRAWRELPRVGGGGAFRSAGRWRRRFVRFRR